MVLLMVSTSFVSDLCSNSAVSMGSLSGFYQLLFLTCVLTVLFLNLWVLSVVCTSTVSDLCSNLELLMLFSVISMGF